MLRKSLILIVLSIFNLAYAFDINSFFLNQNQQGMKLLNNQQYQEAWQKFDDPNWQAVAKYRANDYQAALDTFSQDNSAKGLYNQGNSLAHMKKYDEAIAKYDEALKIKPDFEDAKYNKELLEKLKQNESQNQQDKNDNSQDNKDNKDNKDNQSQDKSNDNKQDSKQDKQDQNQQDQNKQEQHNNDANKTDPTDNKPDQADNQQQQATDKTEEKAQDKSPLAQFEDSLDDKEKEEIEAVLAKVPDDPGGLLRNKFRRDYEKGR